MTHLENTPASPDTPTSTGSDGGPSPRDVRHDRPHAAPPKRALAPDLRGADERTVRAWTEPMAVTPLGGGEYAVEGVSGTGHVVDLPAGTCTCPDHDIRGERCKHLRRVAVEVNRRELPPPGRLAGECRVCGDERYLPEAGPALCDDCRPRPGALVTDRETGDLLAVIRVTADRADETVIEATGTTVADYPNNDGYPRDDPVVEAVYPFSKGLGHPLSDLRRYQFPLSRLESRGESLVDSLE